jgi:hypothetical protein
MPPRCGALADTVGNGYDYSAQVTDNLISVVGSFDTFSTTGETGFTYQSPSTQVANAYTLQLNSNFFYNPPACAGAASPSTCQGWQQYVYSSVSAGQAYIQYWLINYNKTPCPSGWNSYGSDCYTNSASAVTVSPLIPVTSLAQTSLTGSVAAGGNDRLDLAAGATHYIMTSPDNIVTLASYWNTAEFTVVGDCCLYTANFAANTSIAVRTTTHDGLKTAPICVLEGFTGETNNLNLASTPAIGTQASPTLISDQSSAAAPPASCATAAGRGDLHITTFTPTPQANPVTDLHYDFQAEGDFILAKMADGFEVQTRQISGAPNWPLATVSEAIAAKIGKSAVVFAWVNNNPQVFINGSAIALGNGEKHVLPNDGDLILSQNTVSVSDSTDHVVQNTYVARDANGNSVQVIMQVYGTAGTALEHYIDTNVGLGSWPTNVQGLLVNAKNNLLGVIERDGTVFTVHNAAPPPASVDLPDFYSKYGDSWRVTGSQSLFTAVASQLPALRVSNPAKVFTASDLAADVAATAKANCQNAGVPDVALNDCILDVAVIGNWQAALSHLHPNLSTVVDRAHLVEH